MTTPNPCTGAVCPIGQECSSETGFCGSLSCLTNPCPMGSTCNDNNACRPDLRTCDGSVICPTGLVCTGGLCALQRCTVDSDCSAGFFCRGERCVDDPFRCVNVHCQPNEICSQRTGECSAIRCSDTRPCPVDSNSICVDGRCALLVPF